MVNGYAVGNIHRQFGEVWTSRYLDMLTDRYTEKHTRSQCFAPLRDNAIVEY